ncbi:MAG: carboxypeptidase-like regulatory domain-containing protein [Candidatus Marinimicrobia bacterium]|nr:carboxypeptidase-like regulatory domain-containing protein [Candidatus Neomarinimicrobiota bacterium]
MKSMIIISAFFLLLSSCDLGDELDKAIIDVSGKVSHDGNAVTGAIVLLVEDVSISSGLSLANGSISDNSGHYTILNVDPGSYYVLAVDDRDGNLQLDATTDRIGFYGVVPPTDLEANQISVSDMDVENINITSLYSF